MDHVKYRKYPRIYKKQSSKEKERSIDLSAATAVGILALTFIKGMFWGYILKKRMG